MTRRLDAYEKQKIAIITIGAYGIEIKVMTSYKFALPARKGQNYLH